MPPAPSTSGISAAISQRLKSAFDHNIDKPHRQHGEDIAIAVIAGHARLRFHALQTPPAGPAKYRRRDRWRREWRPSSSSHSRTCRGVRLSPSMQHGTAIDAEKPFAQHRLVQNAQHRHFVIFQRDQRAPFMTAGDEGAGAVHRVEYPAQAGSCRAFRHTPRPGCASSGRSRSMMARMARSPPLSASVTGSKACRAGLVRHFDTLAEKRADHRAAGIGQAIGKGDHFSSTDHGEVFQNRDDQAARYDHRPAHPAWAGSARCRS